MSQDASATQLHEQLRALLGKAHAESCQVIATFLDIRGFTSFTAQGESFDVAIYLRSVFSRILADYFPDADYFKPTGDGLLLVHGLSLDDPDSVPGRVSSVVERCLHLTEDFGRITAGDYMVNFSVPQSLGAGVARGSATRLVSGGQVLDYIGRCLNLAARLMDKARPAGVVFHDVHANQLLSPELAERLSVDRVCLRGVAESQPISVHISDSVEIMPSDREAPPESAYRWGTPSTLSLHEVLTSSSHAFYLPRPPYSFETATVYVECDLFDGAGKRTGFVTHTAVAGSIEESPHGPLVRIPFKGVKQHLEGIPETTQGFWGTKTTRVTFTPCLVPQAEH